MDIIELTKELKTKVAPIYNLVGDDLFLIRQSVQNIKSAIIKDLEEFNYTRVDATKISKSEAEAILTTLPMGNDYRLVVMDKPNAEVVKLIDSLDLADSGVVVVTIGAEKLSKAVAVDCNKLDRAIISKYIKNTLNKDNITIEDKALDYLIEASSMDMSKISNEVNKLASYCESGQVVDLDLVTNMVASYTDYATYMLTTTIDQKDYSGYQKILSEMTKSVSFGDLFSYLGRYFKKMQYIVLNKDDETLSKILNVKPYSIKMSRQYVTKNGINYYLNLYERYIDLDYRIKSGKISAYNALYELIF